MPHTLNMSATPIPRTLALTAYGELDVSVIDELPPGRKPVVTKVIANRNRDRVYAEIDGQIEQGRQVYIVCPTIEESDTLGVKAVTTEYEKLRKTIFSHRTIALLHGRLKPDEKSEILDRFASGETDILISTTVVEVGVDVPNATVLMIEGAERFGLAQLHQLRGRVGRGEHQSYCYVFTSADRQARERLSHLERTNSGFELAEADLELRGPGELYGVRQHGDIDLRIANIADTRTIATAQRAAKKFLEGEYDVKSYPILSYYLRRFKSKTIQS